MLITYLTATACAVAAICLGRSEYEKKALSVEEMNLYSDKVSKDRTFIFLSDLHENTFGPDNEKLIRAIDKIRPDAILNGGDLIVTKENMQRPGMPFPYKRTCHPLSCLLRGRKP